MCDHLLLKPKKRKNGKNEIQFWPILIQGNTEIKDWLLDKKIEIHQNTVAIQSHNKLEKGQFLKLIILTHLKDICFLSQNKLFH